MCSRASVQCVDGVGPAGVHLCPPLCLCWSICVMLCVSQCECLCVFCVRACDFTHVSVDVQSYCVCSNNSDDLRAVILKLGSIRITWGMSF